MKRPIKGVSRRFDPLAAVITRPSAPGDFAEGLQWKGGVA